MPVNFVFNPQDLLRFLPEILLTVCGTFLMVLDPILHKRASYAFGHLSILSPAGRAGRKHRGLQHRRARVSAAC